MRRSVLLAIGVLVLLGLIWHVGLASILAAAAGLGPASLGLVLLPSLLMYGLEAYGWRLTLGRHAATIAFWRLFAVRAAGEAVNLSAPVAYVGGEPVKAFLLERYGVPLRDGFASVVVAKTTMTISQIGFVALGIGLGLLTLRWPQQTTDARALVIGSILTVGLLALFAAVLVLVQRRGAFTLLLRLVRACGIRLTALEACEATVRELDGTIQGFYETRRRAFLLSTGVGFLGWLAEALEVYAMLYVLGGPATAELAIAIGALSVLIKGSTFFIPGSVGAQEGGNLVLLLAFGYSEVTGITFALLRRAREIVWIGIGLICMVAVGRGGRAKTG